MGGSDPCDHPAGAAMIVFEECSTWAEDFRGAILRHYTDSKGAPVGKKQGWRILEDGN